VSAERCPLPEARSAPEHGRVLVVAPHADDDVCGPGGTACLHALQGDPVHVVIAYDGVAGNPEGRYAPEELRELRRAEARAGGRVLGLESYEFFGFPEGHEPGPAEFETGTRRLAHAIHCFEPDIVYAPWVGEQHIDHHVLARAVQVACELVGFRGRAWGYEVWSALVPTRVVDITPVFARKLEALRQHRTQIGDASRRREHRTADPEDGEGAPGVPRSPGLLGLNAHRAAYLPAGAQWGEGFAPLGPARDADRRLVGLPTATESAPA